MSSMVSYFSHEMSWIRSGTEWRQFLKIFLPTLSEIFLNILLSLDRLQIFSSEHSVAKDRLQNTFLAEHTVAEGRLQTYFLLSIHLLLDKPRTFCSDQTVALDIILLL